MLEVNESGLARLESEIKAAAASAQKEYDEFVADSEVDKREASRTALLSRKRHDSTALNAGGRSDQSEAPPAFRAELGGGEVLVRKHGLRRIASRPAPPSAPARRAGGGSAPQVCAA